MNSIIWKGVSSTTINGLLICELPPITKPKMRIKETVIDGKDGSIIEELGYEPYDKTVVIGLYGNYDIDKIIKYFTGEGDIIFSNEPNKIYRAKICGKVDYIRLLRFRQASITFRVQPYKYKFNEFYRETQTATASGTSIAVNDSADANLKALKIYGKSTQDGTPTPSAPVDIVSIGDDGGVTLGISGANLVESKTICDYIQQYGSILFIEAELKPNTQYTFSFKGSAGNKYYFNEFLFTYKSVTVQEGITTATVTTSNNLDKSSNQYVSGKGWVIFKNDINQTKPNIFDELMVNIGGVAIPYQPYAVQITSFTSTLRAIPVTDKNLATYTDASGQMWCADEIDLEKDVYVQRIGKWVIDGSKEPTTFVDGNKGGKVCGYTYADVMSGISNKRLPKMCNRLKPPTTTQPTTYKDCEIGCWSFNTASGDTPDIFLIFNLGEFATPSEVETYLVEHPLTFIGILETPIETPLSAEQIAMCKALKSNEPTTNISNDGNAYMTVEYIKPFEVFNEGLEDSQPLMILKGSGTVEISVNGMHTFTYTFPEGEDEVYIDSEKEDAYLENVLKNRNMNGEFPILIPRTNKIEWSGDVESISILPRSRWL